MRHDTKTIQIPLFYLSRNILVFLLCFALLFSTYSTIACAENNHSDTIGQIDTIIARGKARDEKSENEAQARLNLYCCLGELYSLINTTLSPTEEDKNDSIQEGEDFETIQEKLSSIDLQLYMSTLSLSGVFYRFASLTDVNNLYTELLKDSIQEQGKSIASMAPNEQLIENLYYSVTYLWYAGLANVNNETDRDMLSKVYLSLFKQNELCNTDEEKELNAARRLCELSYIIANEYNYTGEGAASIDRVWEMYTGQDYSDGYSYDNLHATLMYNLYFAAIIAAEI